MTLSVSTQVAPVGSKLIVDTNANSTAKNDVTGTAGTIYMVDVDNEANPTDLAYLKIYDNAAPTIGTTVPDFVIRIPVNQRRSITIPDGLDFTNLSFAVVTTGGTAGSTSPSNSVIVKMITS